MRWPSVPSWNTPPAGRLKFDSPGHLCPEYLEPFAFRRLSAEQESPWVFSFAAELERAEILKPQSVRCVGSRISPFFQPIQILGCDLALSATFKEMIVKRGRELNPFDFRHRSSFSDRRFCESSCTIIRGETVILQEKRLTSLVNCQATLAEAIELDLRRSSLRGFPLFAFAQWAPSNAPGDRLDRRIASFPAP